MNQDQPAQDQTTHPFQDQVQDPHAANNLQNHFAHFANHSFIQYKASKQTSGNQASNQQ